MQIPKGYDLQVKSWMNAGIIKRMDLSNQVFFSFQARVALYASDPAHTPEQVAEFKEALVTYTGNMLRQFVPTWRAVDFRTYVQEIQSIPF